LYVPSVFMGLSPIDEGVGVFVRFFVHPLQHYTDVG
jgi:hypothetical protein